MSLVFKQTQFDKLEKGTKYIIKRYNNSYYTGIFSGYSFCMRSMSGVSHFCDLRDIHMQGTYVWKIDFYDEESISYHMLDIQKEKIQNAMELRATNIILRRITNDESFKY